MSEKDPIVIASLARTPIGAFQGDFTGLPATQLGGIAIQAAVERAGLAGDQVQELIFGCVLPAGLGQAPARQAAFNAGLPVSVGCTTVNKVCGSGMKATMLAHDALIAGSNDIIVSGGMESMTNAPYLLPKARGGYRLGHGRLIDHMFLDGIEDAYFDQGRLMGTFAEDCATSYHFSREEQDAFAIASTQRARSAIESGVFQWETVPVTVSGGQSERVIHDDEMPLKARIDKIPELKPAFKKEGTVTPANSSSISDSGAALVLMRQSTADKMGITPEAVIRGHATHSQEPRLFTTAPAGAMQKLMDKTHWTVEEVDLWEINEAFAVVTMAAMRDLELDHDKVNIHGGACAMGHPLGASGARLLVTLIGALRATGGTRGIASLCIGGGEATAMAVEML